MSSFTMKALSTILLLPSLTNFRVASGAEIRVESVIEDKALQEKSNHDLTEADEYLTEDDSALLKFIAEDFNLSIEDAKKWRDLEHDFEQLVGDLFHDGNFLQADVPTEHNGPFVLKFKNGKVPEKGQAGIKSFMAKNKNAKLEIVHSKLSLKEAKERGARLVARLKSKGHSRCGYLIDGDDLEVWAEEPQQKAQRSLREAKREDTGRVSLSRAAEVFDLDHDHRDLEGLELYLYEHNDEDMSTPQGKEAEDSTHARTDARKLRTKGNVHSGTKMWAIASGACTSGFMVQHKKTKQCGVVTAGHCDEMKYMYPTWKEDGDYVLLYEREKSIDKDGEFRWYAFSSTWTATDETYHAKGDAMYVKEIAEPILAKQRLCFYARQKGESKCGKVRSLNAEVNNEENQVVVSWDDNKHISRVGDSGGPWYKEWGVAYGVHGGRADHYRECEKRGRSCVHFSKVYLIEDKLNLKLYEPGDKCNRATFYG